MAAIPLNHVKEDLVHLENFVDEGDESSEYEVERIARKSRRRPLIRSQIGRGHNRDIERCAVDPAPRLRISVRGFGCSKLARLVFASAVGFFIAL